jgi:G:T/U-mismatch repair DNA glycosylase
MSWNDDKIYHWSGRDHEVIKEHPYDDLLPVGMKILIIGSFPSNAPRHFDLFYGSKVNRFWDLISGVYRHDFVHKKNSPAADERREFLGAKKLGLTDMLTQCYRYRKRSGDEFLSPVAFKDIFRLLEAYPTVVRLVFTGRQFIIGPLGLFITYLHQRDYGIEELQKDKLGNLTGKLSYKDRSIDIRVPYSPSARLAENPDHDFQDMVRMYRDCLSI